MFDHLAKGCADSNIFKPRQTGAMCNWTIWLEKTFNGESVLLADCGF